MTTNQQPGKAPGLPASSPDPEPLCPQTPIGGSRRCDARGAAF